MNKFLYLISPSKINSNFYTDLQKILQTRKVKFFQLRLKKTSESSILQIAKKIKKITNKFNVKLIINDNPKITKKINADGCHIGQKDFSFAFSRKILRSKVVGVTCHGSKKLVNIAIKNKADYIAIGSFFKSELKPNAKKAKLEIISYVKKKTKIPIVVIGGINPDNYKRLLNLGANYIAISSFIWNNPFLKPLIAIKKFIK
ncbi:MAG: thiamine-phosphate pyrophosphorylase [Pelagibacterales bacterium]|nr:thiamine-phosphate pyrophosphorylase [Pelagibacterales bacterium]